MKDRKYKICFSSIVKPLVSEEKDKCLALASLQNLKPLLPWVGTVKNEDLLPVAMDLCVVNRMNKNGDAIDKATALDIIEGFRNKFIDIEHNRKHIVGTILTTAFTEFGTSRLLTNEEVTSISGPFNISLGGVLWRVANSDICDLIEESGDPESKYYQAISASWEIGFDAINIAILPQGEKDLTKASLIIKDPIKVAELLPKLKYNGGDGKYSETETMCRVPSEGVCAYGLGLTERPAAEVKGILVPEEKIPNEIEEIDDAKKKCTDSEVKTVEIAEYLKDLQPGEHYILICDCGERISTCEYSPEELKATKKIVVPSGCAKCKNKKSISQTLETSVNKNRLMKITKLEEITDELVKQESAANAIHEFVLDEIKKITEKYASEKNQKDQEIEASKRLIAELQVNLSNLTKTAEETKKQLSALQAEAEIRTKQEKLNERMAKLAGIYELTTEDEQVLASRIKDMDDTAFTAYENELAILLKEKNKESKAKKTTSAAEIIDGAVDNAKKKEDLPKSSKAEEPSLKEKFAKAFSLQNWTINV